MSDSLLVLNAELYAPEYQGIQDILIINGRIVAIGKNLKEQIKLPGLRILDAAGKKAVPGYIDQHVHIIGGGGESGPYSRTPEVMLSDITSAGVTTVIGVLGTDGTSRHTESLLAKARGLEAEGVSAYILTGSYEVPLHTVTGDARKDIILIDKVLGIGEVALSDHRSSEPTKEELKKILTQARLGGMLSGKSGVVQFHMGVGKKGLQVLFDILDESEIPAAHMIPTHINRSVPLFEQAKLLAKRGGYIDITSGIREKDGFPECVKPSEAIKDLWNEGIPMNQVTMSSDGNGCMSVRLPDGSAKQLVTKLASLHEEVRDAVISGVPIEVAVSVCTSNPARANGLYPKKGCLQEGSDGDLLLLDCDFNIDTVIASGKIMVADKHVLIKGTFEK